MAAAAPRAGVNYNTPSSHCSTPAAACEVPLLPRHFRTRPVVVLETRVVRGSGGGPDKTILNTPRFLRAAGYETLCAYMRPPGDPGFPQLERKARRWQAPL